MGCRKLQLNNYFSFVEKEVNPQNGFRFVGNRLSKQCSLGFQPENISYSYNDNDQLLTETSTVDGTTEYQYDANGSLISKVNQSQNESYSYTYNLQNRLASANITRVETEPLSGLSKLIEITANYVYNQSGIRVASNTSTTIDGGTPEVKNTTYLIDPANFTGYAQVLEESTNGTLTKSYTLGDDILSQSSVISGQLSVNHFQYDGHGSTRLLTSDTSTITARYNYDAYGNMCKGNPSVVAPSATNMLYSGELFDPNLQMQYLRARYYDQSNGRFNRLDPFAGNNYDPQSLHKYAYTHCNPVMGIDPSGEVNLIEVVTNMNFQSIITTFATKGVINAVSNGIIDLIFAVYKREGVNWKNFSIDFATNFAIGGITSGVGAGFNKLSKIKKFINYGLAKKLLYFIAVPGVIKGVVGTMINFFVSKAKGNTWSSQKLREELLFNVIFTLGFDGISTGLNKVKTDHLRATKDFYKGEYGKVKKKLLKIISGERRGNLVFQQAHFDYAVNVLLRMDRVDNIYRIITDTMFGDLLTETVQGMTQKMAPLQPLEH